MTESKNKVPRALATAGQPRRKVRMVITRTRVTAAMASVLVTLAGTGVWWSFTSDGLARGMEKAKWDMIARTAQLGFRVEDILVVGRVETPRGELLEAVHLSRGPILAFDIKAARQRVEALPWIRSARVERMLPDTILLNVEERQPLALWQHQVSSHSSIMRERLFYAMDWSDSRIWSSWSVKKRRSTRPLFLKRWATSRNCYRWSKRRSGSVGGVGTFG